VATIIVNPPSLSFQTAIGAYPLAAAVSLTASQFISFTVTASTTTGGNWLQVTPAAGVVSSGGGTAVVAIPSSTVIPLLTPGTYNGSIVITPTSGTALTPVVVPVTLTVLPAPPVTVSPPSVSLNYQVGGSNNSPQQTVTLTTTSAQGVAFTASATNVTNSTGQIWAVADPASGTVTPAGTPVTISYQTGIALSAGTWSSIVTVNTPNGSPATTNIPVTLLISSLPLLNVPASPLNFTYELGASNPAAQPVAITATSGKQAYSVAVTTSDGAAWLVAPASGTTPAPLSVSVNPAGLAPGNYSGTVAVTGVGTGNGTLQIPVTLKVSNDPKIVANFTSLSLPYQLGQAQAVAQAIAVSSSNGLPLNFTATAKPTTCGTWFTVNGATGTTGTSTGSGQFTVALNPQSLAAGTCTGTVSIAATNSITGTAALNSPLTIPVTAIVSASPLLVVSPLTPVVFTAQAGGTNPPPQSFTLTSTDGSQLNFSIASSTANGGSGWLQVSQTNGQTTSGLNSPGISVQTGQLAAGTYTGSVTISATGAGGAPVPNTPLTIPVTLIVTSGSLVLGQSALSFSQSTGGTAPPNQVVTISSSGPQLSFAASAYNSGSVNWLTVSPSGVTPGSISVAVNGAALPQGTYTGTVIVYAISPNAGNSPSFLTVTLSVNAGTILASPGSLVFTQVQGGPAPPDQKFTLFGNPGTIAFQTTANSGSGGTWLSASPASGSTPEFVTVSIAANSLAVGSYNGNVSVVAPGAVGSPLQVPVTLNVLTPHNLTASPSTITFTANAGSSANQSGQVQLSSAGGPTVYSLSALSANWFGVSPTSGQTPASLTLTVSSAGLAVGAYSGTFTISTPNAVSAVTVTVNLVVGTVTLPAVTAVANAGSYSTGGVSPGENIVIFGTGIGPPAVTKGTVTNGIVDSNAGATRVLFDGVASPVIYAFSTQTSAMVPYGVSGRNFTNIVVEYQGVQSKPIAFDVVLTAPGIYAQNQQGLGPGAILNQDYSVNLPSAPAPKGSVVAVYMTGEGFTQGAVDGALATALLTPVLPVSATVAGIPVTPIYAGTAPGLITGVMQVNVQIPSNAPSGPSVPIVIAIGTGTTAVSTQAGITVSVK
jgi:uncharacterized protein (TIGR03437 family)